MPPRPHDPFGRVPVLASPVLALVVLAAGLACVARAAAAAEQTRDPAPRFSVAELREDFQLLRDALDELHPSLHWYTPELELARAFDDAAAQIGQPMTESEFYRAVQPAVAAIRCGHTFLSSSPAQDAWVDRQPATLLPFRLWIDGDKLYVLANQSNDATIQPGDQLLEINGVAASQIITKAKTLMVADGFNQTMKEAQLNALGGSHLKLFAFHGLGLREPFVVTVTRPDGTRSRLTVARKPNPTRSPDAGVPAESSAGAATPSRSFEVLDGGIARLTIKGFNEADASGFHRRIFEEIANKNIRHLIIDLRENSGGNGDDAEDLMTYLMDRPFHSYGRHWAKLRHPESPSFARHLDPATRKQLLDNNRYRRTQGGRFYFDGVTGQRAPASQFRFAGAVYLLTSGRTFSSAALFAASLKAQRRITVIGQETGGGRAGCTAGINQRLTLPHTQMRLRIPVFRIESADPTPNQGHGLAPDEPIHYSWQDVAAGKDLEFLRALELIRQQP
jgi:C-terminal processing protease CtpA/Prc